MDGIFVYMLCISDMSDDEDFQVKNDDEAWNPKIKMSNLGPRQGYTRSSPF
jgi:hypothetical protein